MITEINLHKERDIADIFPLIFARNSSSVFGLWVFTGCFRYHHKKKCSSIKSGLMTM